MRVAVFGLGKLGAPLAAFFASAGHQVVVGYDKNPALVAALNSGKAPVDETGLQALIDGMEYRHQRLWATEDRARAVERSEIIFVVVPTPSLPNGSFSTEYAEDAFRWIGDAMREANEKLPLSNRPYRLVVLVSTVMPGQMRERLISAIANSCHVGPGDRYGVCYNPEFIALGSVLANLQSPDFLLIGEHDARAGMMLEAFYRETFAGLGRPMPTVARMGLENAEVTKLAVNCMVTRKISSANEMAALCEKIPGADAAVVLRAVGLDRRIGPAYLTPAVPYGGPCFPRDGRAMMAAGESVGIGMLLCETTDEINSLWLISFGMAIYRLKPDRVCILGAAYKPNTKVREEAFGVNLHQWLRNRSIPTTIFEPEELSNHETVAALAAADVVVLAVACPEFTGISPQQLKPGATIFDCWRQLDAANFPHNPIIVPGKGPTA